MSIQRQRMGSFVNKILPTSYDQSLSYYEVLAKLTKKVNELIEVVNEIVNVLDIEENDDNISNSAQ